MKTRLALFLILITSNGLLWGAAPGGGGSAPAGGVSPGLPTTPTASADAATLFPIPKLDGTLWQNERILGDLGGPREWLAEHGVQFDLTLVQIYQGAISGGDTSQWATNVGTNAVRTLTGEIIDGAAIKKMQLQAQLAMTKQQLQVIAQQRLTALGAQAQAKFQSLPTVEQALLLKKLSQLPLVSFDSIKTELRNAINSKLADGKDALTQVINDKISQLSLGLPGNSAAKDNDYFGLWSFETKIDTGKAGLWPGGFIFMRVQAQYGDSINGRSGAFLPSNVDGVLPEPNFRQVVIPALYLTQFVSEHLAFIAGKLDTTGGDQNEFAHIDGDVRFLGSAFAFNPVVASIAPYSPLGVGAVILPNKNLTITLSAIDGEGVPTQGGFDTAFKGKTSYLGEARLTTHFFGLPGHQLVGGGWGSGEYSKLHQDLSAYVPGEDLSLATVQNTWAAYWNFDQYFWTRPDAPDRGWGMFGRVGAADERVCPIGQFYSAGFGGKGVFETRPFDRWGAGYYYMRSSRDLPAVLDIGSEQGEEFFYTVAVTPACFITADLQVTNSAKKDVDTAVIGGLRATMRF